MIDFMLKQLRWRCRAAFFVILFLRFTSARANPLDQWVSLVPDSVYGLASGNGQFVVAGSGIYTSPDGTNWNQRASVESNDVAFGNGRFVVAGKDKVLVSTDGISWSQRNDTFAKFGIGFGNGVFVMTGSDIRWSLDGVQWARQEPVPDGPARLNAVLRCCWRTRLKASELSGMPSLP